MKMHRAPLAAVPEMRLKRNRVERDETGHDPADAPPGDQQPDVGPAVGDDLQVLQAGPEDRAHQGHRLAPRSPAADADRHARAQFPGHLVGAHDRHAVTAARRRTPAWLCPTRR